MHRTTYHVAGTCLLILALFLLSCGPGNGATLPAPTALSPTLAATVASPAPTATLQPATATALDPTETVPPIVRRGALAKGNAPRADYPGLTEPVCRGPRESAGFPWVGMIGIHLPVQNLYRAKRMYACGRGSLDQPRIKS